MIGVALGLPAFRRLVPPGTLVARRGPPRHRPRPGRPDLRLLRRRRLRLLRPDHRPRALRRRGRHRPHRGHPHLDRGLVAPGPLARPLRRVAVRGRGLRRSRPRLARHAAGAGAGGARPRSASRAGRSPGSASAWPTRRCRSSPSTRRPRGRRAGPPRRSSSPTCSAPRSVRAWAVCWSPSARRRPTPTRRAWSPSTCSAPSSPWWRGARPPGAGASGTTRDLPWRVAPTRRGTARPAPTGWSRAGERRGRLRR